MIGVYKIESPSGKIYVGSSLNIFNRFKKYKSLNCKSQTRLYNSLVKYGVNNHFFSILIECDKEELYEYEHLYSNYYNVLGSKGLNCVIVGYKEIKSIRSKETIEKHRKAITGRFLTEEQKISKRNYRHTTLAKQKISAAMSNRKVSDLTKNKLSLLPRKLVLNLESGVFYDSSKEAGYAHKICAGNLSSMLNGKRNNKTSLKYV